MLFKKKGLPEESDIILCTVKKILYHSVFVTLDEYDNQEAMVHISEIAPGRIRNIRDYVVEGKKLVCKVLKVNHERRQVDLSLRRVSLAARKNKNEEFKQEQKAEKMLELLAVKLKEKKEDIINKVGAKIMESYDTIFSCFQDVSVRGEGALMEIGIDEKYVKPLYDIIAERIKPQELFVVGTLTLTSISPKGINDIKKALAEGVSLAEKENLNLTITYLGAPNFKVQIGAPEYKEAEESLNKVVTKIIDNLKAAGGKGEFKKK
ncbi:MAG: translation initiation factor IF-2 subunit alpha [Candidatus Woesearchaeota archaeon]